MNRETPEAHTEGTSLLESVIQEILAGSVTFEDIVTHFELLPEQANRLAEKIKLARYTVTIPISELYPFEVSAIFFATLIEPADPLARRELALAECRRQFRHDEKSDPNWGRIQQCWPPEYLVFNLEEADKLHKRAMRILEGERMIAAERGLAFLYEAIAKARGSAGLKLREAGEVLGPLTPENFDLWALRQQRQLAGRPDDPDRGTPKTVEQRAWKKTKPVLHLAMAVHCVTRGKAEADGQAIWAAMFNDKRETEKLLNRAEWFQRVMLEIAQQDHSRFKLKEEDTVHVIAR